MPEESQLQMFQRSIPRAIRKSPSPCRNSALAQITRQPQKRQMQPCAEDVVFHFLRGKMLRDFRPRGGHEGSHRRGFVRSGSHAVRGDLCPLVQPFAKQQYMLCRISGESEVREKEARRLAFQDRGERVLPNLEINVRWRGSGHHVGMALDAYTGGVAHECNALVVIEVADVMRSVARRIDDFEFTRAERERFAPIRSEEHTSELQSLAYLVCRLLLEKKKTISKTFILINKKHINIKKS